MIPSLGKNPTAEEEKAYFDTILNESMKPLYERNRRLWKIGYTSLNEEEWSIQLENLEQNEHTIRVRSWTPQMSKGAVLYGDVGTGKSTLGKALINRWANPSYRALFVGTAEALDRLRDSIDSEETSLEMEMLKLETPELLILDDLGTEKSTEWSIEKIFTIFESRARSGKHTWFTTNLNKEAILKKYGPRIQDRLLQFCSWVKCEGKSYRKMNYKSEI